LITRPVFEQNPTPMRLHHFVVGSAAFLVLFFAQACGGKQPVKCMSSADCGLGQVCSAGTCQTQAMDAGGTGGGSFFFPDASTAGGSAGGTGGSAGGGSTTGCGPQNCPAGCCDMNGICQGGTTRTACGVGGTMCVTCGPGRICQGGACANPTGGGSAGGGAAGGGLPGCGPSTCATGCCDVNNLCVPGTTPQACGIGGRICIGCFGSDTCSGGSCVPSTGGGSAGGGSAGGVTGGGTTAGGSAGGNTAGGSTAGGATAGGATAGGATSGGTTAGGAAGGGTAGGAALAGDTCATAEAIAGGTLSSPMSVMGSTVGYSNDYTGSNQTGCYGTGGRDRVYSVSVAPNARLLANIRSTLSAYDPSINFIVGPEAQCSAIPRVCVTGDDLGGSTTVNAGRYLNTTTSTQTVFVVADSFTSGDLGGTFRLDVSVDTPVAGDTCESPTVLTSGTPRLGEVLSGFANDYFARSGTASSCVGASDGVDRVYSTLVGAGETLQVTVTPSASLDTAIALHGDAAECLSRTCQTGSNTGGAGVADQLVWRNTGTTARTMLIVVETAAGASGTFSISTTTGALPGDYCSNTVAPITTAQTLTGQSLVGYAVDYSQTTAANGCEDSSGPDHVHQVTVPPRTRLVGTVTPTNMDPVINIVPGATSAVCDAMPRICGGSADGFASGSAETAVWDNGTTSPQNVYFVVAGYNSSSANGTYSLGVNYTTGDHCRSPTPVSGPFPRTFSNETFTGFRKDIVNGTSVAPCRNYTGPDRVYEVTIPARAAADAGVPRMDFNVTTATVDVVLNVYNFESTCVASPSVCLAGADTNITAPASEAVSITNPNLVPVTVYVGVSTYNASAGTYSATVNITTP